MATPNKNAIARAAKGDSRVSRAKVCRGILGRRPASTASVSLAGRLNGLGRLLPR